MNIKKQQQQQLTIDSVDQLVSNVSNLFNGISNVVVVFQEIKDWRTKNFKGETNMSMIIKPVEHLNT